MTDKCIDLNCDLGEYQMLSAGAKDVLVMPWISSCNIACGGHAGNTAVIQQTIKLALQHQVKIGAHPSYPDRKNFGRCAMSISEIDLRRTLIQQIQLVKDTAKDCGAVLSHVKPHGALYNQAAVDADLALLVAETVAGVDKKLWLYGLAGSMLAYAAQRAGVRFIAEGFADRSYTADGTLVPRNEVGAVLETPEEQMQQVLTMLTAQKIKSITGEEVAIHIDTLCLHGDHAEAVNTAILLNQGLQKAGFHIQAPQQ